MVSLGLAWHGRVGSDAVVCCCMHDCVQETGRGLSKETEVRRTSLKLPLQQDRALEPCLWLELGKALSTGLPSQALGHHLRVTHHHCCLSCGPSMYKQCVRSARSRMPTAEWDWRFWKRKPQKAASLLSMNTRAREHLAEGLSDKFVFCNQLS